MNLKRKRKKCACKHHKMWFSGNRSTQNKRTAPHGFSAVWVHLVWIFWRIFFFNCVWIFFCLFVTLFPFPNSIISLLQNEFHAPKYLSWLSIIPFHLFLKKLQALEYYTNTLSSGASELNWIKPEIVFQHWKMAI